MSETLCSSAFLCVVCRVVYRAVSRATNCVVQGSCGISGSAAQKVGRSKSPDRRQPRRCLRRWRRWRRRRTGAPKKTCPRKRWWRLVRLSRGTLEAVVGSCWRRQAKTHCPWAFGDLLRVGACVPSCLVSLFFFRLSVGPSSALGFLGSGSFGGVGFFGRCLGCRRCFALRAPLGGWAPPKEPEPKNPQGLRACPPSFTEKKTGSPVPRYSAQTLRRPQRPKGKESWPATASNNRPQPPESAWRGCCFWGFWPWFFKHS